MSERESVFNDSWKEEAKKSVFEKGVKMEHEPLFKGTVVDEVREDAVCLSGIWIRAEDGVLEDVRVGDLVKAILIEDHEVAGLETERMYYKPFSQEDVVDFKERVRDEQLCNDDVEDEIATERVLDIVDDVFDRRRFLEEL